MFMSVHLSSDTRDLIAPALWYRNRKAYDTVKAKSFAAIVIFFIFDIRCASIMKSVLF